MRIATVLAVILAFVACDDDYSTIGGDIIDNPTDVAVEEYDVVAYSEKIGAVQSNNLPNHLLGVYNDPVYGQTTASILTQLSLSTSNPNFGNEPQLDSVVLNIPYYSSEAENDIDDEVRYVLDSVYGNEPFKISLFRSNYFLSDFDPAADFEQRQRYWSNQQEQFENNIVGDAIYENESFRPSSEAIVTFQENEEGEMDTITTPPAMRIKLPVDFFQQNIIDREGSSELSNNSNFRNFLRGLFIKAEPVNDDGSLILFDLEESDAGITLYYTHQIEVEGQEETEDASRSYELNFGENIVNTFEDEFPEDLRQQIESADEEYGEERLFLKGGEGSMAVIELFEDETQLEELRENNWLLNEANLTFYVDQERMAGVDEPERVYLYDLTNNRILQDYQYTASNLNESNQDDPLNSLTSFSSRLERDEDENGVSYTISLTRHLAVLLNNEEAENVKLGLVVTQNINNTSFSAIRDAEGDEISRIPAMSILAPQGTVLHGNESENEEKRVKLRIYYTEVN